MIDALLDLWITRLHEQEDQPPEKVKASALATALRTKSPPRNLLVIGKTVAEAREAALASLRAAAHADLYDGLETTTGWLAVDVPVPHRVDPTLLIHRMIRRLYFAAVLHGLAELPAWREAVQSLRLSYLQTRGKVTTATNETTTGKLGADFGFSFSLDKPITAKLTASEEVKLAQSLSATMERLDLYEAEDQLLYDLEVLAALDAQVDRYAEFANPRLPRWEHVRAFFKATYAKLRADQNRRFVLQPVFVFEIHGGTAMVSVLSLLAQAAAVASAQGARVVLVGQEALAHAWKADAELGGPLFRDAFDCFYGSEAIGAREPELHPRQRALIYDLVAKSEGLSAELRAVLGMMFEPGAGTPPSN